MTTSNEFEFEFDEIDAEADADSTRQEAAPADIDALVPNVSEKTDETITNEEIDKLKALGFEKPHHISWPRWIGPRDFKSRHEHIIHMSAMGMTNTQIATELNMTDSWISTVLKTPKVAEAVRIKREQLFSGDQRAYLQSLIHKSFNVIEEILTNPAEKSATRLDAAKYIADQTVGKAQQIVKHEGSVLKEFIFKLDQQLSRDVNAATELEKLDAPADPIDAFVTDMVPENGLVVGKRNE